MSCPSETLSHRQKPVEPGISYLYCLCWRPLERAALASDAKEIYDEAMNATYNLDFNIAERGYETLTRTIRKSGLLDALASLLWYEDRLRSGRS